MNGWEDCSSANSFSADVGVQELVGDVGEDGGATRPDAAHGHEDEEARQVFAEVLGGEEFRAGREEICGEVGEVIAGGEAGGEPLAEMARTKAKLRLRTEKAAALAVLIAMLTAGAGRGFGDGGLDF